MKLLLLLLALSLLVIMAPTTYPSYTADAAATSLRELWETRPADDNQHNEDVVVDWLARYINVTVRRRQ